MDLFQDQNDRIFVFGSNLAGRHGKGAALDARLHHGAIYGKGFGLQGKSYAIPTKDENLNTLPLTVIQTYVAKFIAFAKQHREMEFEVTKIGCGLAGYTPQDIAPLFNGAPKNCHLPPEFKEVIRAIPKLSGEVSFTAASFRPAPSLYPNRPR